jgi:glycosyltransferase involved in cell wall biosynthesis
VKIGVVVSCYRQERFLARTVGAIERALEGRDWRGVLEFATPSALPLPPRSHRWQVLSSFDPRTGATLRPLTPGAGRMVGFAACGGDWVLFADSDVEVDPAWMRSAIETAAREPQLAGIGARIEEWFVDGDRERPGRRDLLRAGDTERVVDHLAALAFYRRAALSEVGGYDARLDSDEDFELGLRLRARGLQMRSLGQLGARHWSAPRPSFGELARRWQTGICFGTGQVLRLYAGRPGFGTLLWRQRFYLAALGLWGLGAAALVAWGVSGDARPLAAWAWIPFAVVAIMGVRKRSLKLGLHSLLTWTLQGFGLIVGLFRLPRAAAPALPAAAAAKRGSREPAC